MIWLQGWTVTTGGTGSSLRAPALFRPAKRGRYSTQVQMGRGWWRPTAGRKLRAAGGTEVCRGAAGKYPTPKCFCFISASCWIVGVWGGEGLTEALRGPLIGRHSALWPLWWCRVTGQTARGDWLAATAVECATSGVRGWKRAAWTPTLPRPPNSLFLRPVLFFFVADFLLSFLQNFSINRLNIKY